MYVKETKFNQLCDDSIVTVHRIDDYGQIYKSIVIEINQDIDFGIDDFPNGFSNDVKFEDAELVNGEYLCERFNSHRIWNPTESSILISNRTFFNERKQKIRVEEKGKHEDFIQHFFYDEEGYLIEECNDAKLYGLFFFIIEQNIDTTNDSTRNIKKKSKCSVIQIMMMERQKFFTLIIFMEIH